MVIFTWYNTHMTEQQKLLFELYKSILPVAYECAADWDSTPEEFALAKAKAALRYFKEYNATHS